MKIHEILREINELAPFSYQESYDNSGLLVGNPETEVNGALLCLDVTEAVVEEAKEAGLGLIIAHHPVIFSGIKRLTGKTYTERIIIKAIQYKIAILCVHTNLDNVYQGVNAIMAEKLELLNTRILKLLPNTLFQLYTYVPEAYLNTVRDALFAAGAGQIGNYSECGFSTSGIGTFKPNEKANPFSGELLVRKEEQEIKIELVFPAALKSAVVAALKRAHPYEEVAFGIIPLQNSVSEIGAGMMGELKEPMPFQTFLQQVKEAFKTGMIRYTKPPENVQKIALCGGSGSFLLPDALAAGADVFLTADFKYHQFFDAEDKIMIVDIGHYESEQFTPEIFYRLFTKKFPTFALQFTSVSTNPVYYF